MAGIWDYVTVTGDETQKRVNVSLLRTELVGVGLAATTRAEARASVEAALGEVLSAAALTDLGAIADQLETGTTTARLVYAHKMDYALNAGELNLIDEATFRSVLGI